MPLCPAVDIFQEAKTDSISYCFTQHVHCTICTPWSNQVEADGVLCRCLSWWAGLRDCCPCWVSGDRLLLKSLTLVHLTQGRPLYLSLRLRSPGLFVVLFPLSITWQVFLCLLSQLHILLYNPLTPTSSCSLEQEASAGAPSLECHWH